jgi:hypothetical protein
MTVTTEEVMEWLHAAADGEDEDAIFELRWATENEVYPINSVPETHEVRVLASETDITYDSYGNGYNGDAFVVIQVTELASGDSANFKLPGEYASYEGWSWHIDKLVQVTEDPKVITVTEWTAI